MIRPPSVQKPYDEFYSGDPAFVQPPKDASEAALKDYAAKVKRARDTGDWSPLLIEGVQPTRFVMQVIKGDQWRWLLDQSSRDDEFKIGPAEFWHLMFRCALVEVANLGAEVNSKPVKHRHLGAIAPVDVPNLLDTFDAAIVTELASAAFERSRTLNPL